MILQDIKQRWTLAVSVIILLNGTLFKISTCDTSDNGMCNNGICHHKRILGVILKSINPECHFSSDELSNEINGIKLCVISYPNKEQAACCHTNGYDCEFEISTEIEDEKYILTLKKRTLSTQDIVIMTSPEQNFDCKPSNVYNHSGFPLNPNSCLNCDVKNIRLTRDDISGNTVGDGVQGCEGADATRHRIMIILNPPKFNITGETDDSITLPTSSSNNITTIADAVNVFNNLSYLVEKMGTSNRTTITMGNIHGIISKIHAKNPSHIKVCSTTQGDFNLCRTNTTLANKYSLFVDIPKEASTKAVKRNGSFVAVFRFKEMEQGDDEDVVLFNNEMLGIDMEVNISNLSDTIDIKYANVDKGNLASCRSWDGKGKKPNWITDGCETLQSNGSITCQCSHLTFFAVLLSPPPGNISSSDFRSLSYITSIGCGVSIFFLALALFMHFVIRKNIASLGTKILMNLFFAMLTLNLTFLTNEFIANLGNFGACVTIAALTHYFMLATVTWFFVEALHLYINLWKSPTEIKHYMMKICATGWVTPAAVVILLLALRSYNYMVIYIDDGNSAEMCWISNPITHQVVNISYYGVVFIFTVGIFIITVQMSLKLKYAKRKSQGSNSVKSNSFSILGLFFMLGLTWAFAFFSHGPLLISSYYIFTILNSFQGFFLFIYYVKTRKIAADKEVNDKDTSSTVTSNTTLSSVSQ